tara:strand:+ start:15180 stop:15698 length:519 start_codon:yes stop_codon:yes gene_type:complete
MINNLIKLSNHLDTLSLYKEASRVDRLIKRVATQDQSIEERGSEVISEEMGGSKCETPWTDCPLIDEEFEAYDNEVGRLLELDKAVTIKYKECIRGKESITNPLPPMATYELIGGRRELRVPDFWLDNPECGSLAREYLNSYNTLMTHFTLMPHKYCHDDWHYPPLWYSDGS